MNTGKTRHTSGIGRALLGALALVTILSIPLSTFAATPPAGTKITNTVTVTWLDSGGDSGTDSASATITVDFKAAGPTIAFVAESGSLADGETITLEYTVTSGGNGLDPSILLTPAVADDADISAATDVKIGATSNPSAGTYTITDLGGSALIQAASTSATTFYVPNDTNTGDSEVHGIASGDKIQIGSNPYTVSNVEENQDATNGWTRITISDVGGLAASDITVLTPINEIQTFYITFTAGDVVTTSDNTTGTHTTTVTPTYDDSATAGGAQGSRVTTITTTLAAITINKYVGATTDAGSAFTTTTADAEPGDTLIYRIVLENASSKTANSVQITDSVPAYTAYEGTSAKASSDDTTVYSSAAALTDDVDGDTYSQSGGSIIYDVGTMVPGAKATLYFEVTIQP